MVAKAQFEKMGILEPATDEEVFQGDFQEEGQNLKVTVSHFEFLFSKKDGQLKQISKKDVSLLKEPLKPNFWRVPTDNDNGLSNFVTWLYPFIVDEKLRNLADKGRVRSFDYSVTEGQFVLACTMKLPGFKGNFNISYKINSYGELTVVYEGEPSRELSRFGATMEVVGNFEQVRWFGKGPDENYCDRNKGAYKGVYDMAVSEMIHDYVRPQENGNRTGVHWLSLSDADTEIFIEAIGEPLEMSVWPYSYDQLDEATHIHGLSRNETRTLNIDHRQKGVGGDYPGGLNLKEPYIIHKGNTYRYSFRLSLMDKGQ